MQREPITLVFNAILISDDPSDYDRRFALNYFVNDGTVSINEAKNPKLGIPGGRFLIKMKVIDPRTQAPYVTESFFIGAKIQAAGRVFVLVDAPEFTLCYMEAHPEIFPQSDLGNAIAALGEASRSMGINLLESFQAKDPTNSLYVSEKEAQNILSQFLPSFTKQQAVTVMRRFLNEDLVKYTEI